MPAVVRLNDISCGHCYEPRRNVESSPNVFVNGIGVHLIGHKWPTHTCGESSHDGVMAEGSSNVFVNGKSVARIGDLISCGDITAEGSSNVFVN